VTHDRPAAAPASSLNTSRPCTRATCPCATGRSARVTRCTWRDSPGLARRRADREVSAGVCACCGHRSLDGSGVNDATMPPCLSSATSLIQTGPHSTSACKETTSRLGRSGTRIQEQASRASSSREIRAGRVALTRAQKTRLHVSRIRTEGSPTIRSSARQLDAPAELTGKAASGSASEVATSAPAVRFPRNSNRFAPMERALRRERAATARTLSTFCWTREPERVSGAAPRG
jgi:hypothetical protein